MLKKKTVATFALHRNRGRPITQVLGFGPCGAITQVGVKKKA